MIDKATAFTIAGNDYRLCDKDGKEWVIDGVVKNYLHISNYNGVYELEEQIRLDYIGHSYFILAHPMDNLTKEINGVVHLIELAKIAYNTNWFYKEGNINVISTGKAHGFEYNKGNFELYSMNNGGFLPIKNQLELFNYLNKNHFSHFLPEGSWKEIKL